MNVLDFLKEKTEMLAKDASGMDIIEGECYGGLRVTLVRPARLRGNPGVQFLPAKITDEGGTVLWRYEKHPTGRWDRAYLVNADGELVIAHAAVKKRLVTLVIPMANLREITTTASTDDGDKEPCVPRPLGEVAELKFRATRILGMNAAFTAREMEVVPTLQGRWNKELELAARRALAEKVRERLESDLRERAAREEEERARNEARLEEKRRAEMEAEALNAFKRQPVPNEPLVAPPAAAVAPVAVESKHRESGSHKLTGGSNKGTHRPFVPPPPPDVRLQVACDGSIRIREIGKPKKAPIVFPPEEQERRRLANIAARAAARAARKAKKAERLAKRLAAKASKKNKDGGNKKNKKKG